MELTSATEQAVTVPTQAAPPGAAVERCSSCSATMASDQRYCVACGQRQGEPRLPFMDAAGYMKVAGTHRQEQPPAPKSKPKRRMSPNATMIAAVGTLLLAMGVGVLIGNSANRSGSAENPVQVVKVPGVAAAGAQTASTGSSSAGATKAKNSSASDKNSGGGSTAANSVLRPTKAAGKLPPATVDVGAPGRGRGYRDGHFTGDFFGP